MGASSSSSRFKNWSSADCHFYLDYLKDGRRCRTDFVLKPYESKEVDGSDFYYCFFIHRGDEVLRCPAEGTTWVDSQQLVQFAPDASSPFRTFGGTFRTGPQEFLHMLEQVPHGALKLRTNYK